MTTKRVLGRVVMIAALAAMTAGVMPAPGGNCSACMSQSATVPNIHTYDEQSSNGNLFDQIRAWFMSLFA